MTAEPIIAQAVRYAGRGGPEVVSIGERVVRAPDAGEIRLRVAAAAVNPTDILLRDPGLGDLPLPLTPGMDASGVVEAVGEGVSRLSVGDEVIAVVAPLRPEGGAEASHIVIPAVSAVRKPDGVMLTDAATIPMNGMTALSALDHASLSSGQTLAVSGGAGWLAYQTIVIAKQRGMHVIADAKAADFDLVRGYGADIVVERGSDFAAAVRYELSEGVDALLDTALLGKAAFPAIRDGGVYIPVRGWQGPMADPGVRIRPVLVNEILERTDWLDQLRELVEIGALIPRVAGTYALNQIVEAQAALLKGGVRGRPLLLF